MNPFYVDYFEAQCGLSNGQSKAYIWNYFLLLAYIVNSRILAITSKEDFFCKILLD